MILLHYIKVAQYHKGCFFQQLSTQGHQSVFLLNKAENKLPH